MLVIYLMTGEEILLVATILRREIMFHYASVIVDIILAGLVVPSGAICLQIALDGKIISEHFAALPGVSPYALNSTNTLYITTRRC